MISLPTLVAPQTSFVLLPGCLLTTRPMITLLLLMALINQFLYRTCPPYFRQERLQFPHHTVTPNSVRNGNIAIITDSLSAMQLVQNPAIRTQTKLSCLTLINTIAESNQLALLWFSSQSGVQGNERANELANVGAALKTLGPNPVPPLSHSHIKTRIGQWSQVPFHCKWLNSPLAQSTKEITTT